MPRLEDNPEYKRAAQLAKVGPETWNSWIGALAAVAGGFAELTKNAPMGTVLRQLGVGVEPDKPGTGQEELERFVLDYAFPGGSNVGGVIKGLKAGMQKGKPGATELRKLMAEEFRSRGKVPDQAAGSDPEWFSRLLRGTAYHAGQYEKFPKLAEKFNPHLGRAGNIGEPQGISLTYNPTVLYGEKGQFVQRPKKLEKAKDKLYNLLEARELPPDTAKKVSTKYKNIQDKSTTDLPFTRVLPRFHGAPEDSVLKGWKGGGDEQLFKDAYVYALSQMPELWKARRGYNPNHIATMFPGMPIHKITETTDIANILVADNNLLNAMSEALHYQSKGLKPLKYDVAEIKDSNLPTSYQLSILEPTNIHSPETRQNRLKLLVDKIKDDFAMDRVPTAAPVIPNYYHLTDRLAPKSQQRRDFNTHITRYLQSKGKRGVLYLPQRYDEYELRVFDPRDVVMLDERTVGDVAIKRSTGEPSMSGDYKIKYGKAAFEGRLPRYMPSRRKEVIANWEDELGRVGYPDTSLGGIYSDIDLPSLELAPDTVRRAQKEEVTLGALTHAMKSEQEGLRLQQSEPRVRGRGEERGAEHYTNPVDDTLNTEEMITKTKKLVGDEIDKQAMKTKAKIIDNTDDPFWDVVDANLKGGALEPGAPGVDPVGMKPWLEDSIDMLSKEVDKHKAKIKSATIKIKQEAKQKIPL